MTCSSRRLFEAALALTAWLGLSSPSFAVQYETDVDIDNETDLYDLSARGEISAETLETLVDLLRDGVDLNAATREEIYELPGLMFEDVDAILKYREQTRIVDPADLVAAGAITQAQLLQIAAFLVLRDGDQVPVNGAVRLMGAYSAEDTQAPPLFLQARGRFPLNFSAGVAMATTRLQMRNLRYSLDSNGLIADAPAYQFEVPKYFVQWKSALFQVAAGTFRIGFGQRLTLDNTTRANPDGFYPDEVVYLDSGDLQRECKYSGGNVDGSACGPEAQGSYITPDFGWREGFRGLAVSLKKLSLGPVDLSAHAFGSYQNRRIYQYEVFNRATCEDPHSDSAECKAPAVAIAGDAAARNFAYSTLADPYDEVAAGGNLTLGLGSGSHIGASGYWAMDLWRNDDPGLMELDFQEWSSRPYGRGSFGAVGIDGAARAGRLNLFGEVTRTFNAMPGLYGGGGWGAVGRIVGNVQKTHEIEGSVHYYDRGFVNPLARPIANPDEFEGQRARNEAGLRIEYLGKPNEDWIVRANVDYSLWPEDSAAKGTAGLSNLDLYLRTDFVGWRKVKLGLWAQYKNKDLEDRVRSLATSTRLCYEMSTLTDSQGNDLPCYGDFIRLAGRIIVEPLGRRLQISAQYQHVWMAEATYRQDMMAWIDVTSFPIDQLRLRWRTRYLNETIDDNADMEQSLWTYLDVGVLPNRIWELHVRYDLYSFLDQRASTLDRKSPFQHRFRLELEARF
ncbi:MAG TPA: hypothetical protein VGK67_29140 [Myxococcales bacterium]|jgi:hypothetical protein